MKNKELITTDLKGYVRGETAFPNPQTLLSKLDNASVAMYGSEKVTNINEDGSKNVSYGRLIMEQKIQLDELTSYTVGMIYAFDTNKPIIKLYSGALVKACLNLCIFQAESILKFDYLNNPSGAVESFKIAAAAIQEKAQEAKRIIDNLKEIHFTYEIIKKVNAELLHRITGEKAISGSTAILNGIKLQEDEKSRYFAKVNGLTAWDYFNSLTEYISDKASPLDQPEKVYQLYKFICDTGMLEPQQGNSQLLLDDSIEILN